MRKKIKKSFEELLAENRLLVQNDDLIMKEIEVRVENKLKIR